MAGNIFFELCGTHIFSPSHNTICTSDGIFFHLKFRESKLLQLLLQGTHDKNKLIDAIWCGGDVSENSYHKLVSTLRSALFFAGMGETIIKTLPRRGCCFMGSVRCFTESDKTHWSNYFNLSATPNTFEDVSAELNQVIDPAQGNVIVHEVVNASFFSKKFKPCQAIKANCYSIYFSTLKVSRIYQHIIFLMRKNLYTCIFIIALTLPFSLQLTPLFFMDFSRVDDGDRTVVTTNFPPGQSHERLDELEWKVIYAANQSSYEVYLLCKSKNIKETVCTSLILE